jgi:uncharacterized Zn-binding protein involved in type VI secretion
MPMPCRMGDFCLMGGIAVAPVATTVLMGGRPAAHLGTMVTPHPGPPKVHPMNPIVAPPCLTVLVGGKPAVKMGTMCACFHPMIATLPSVMVP